MVRIITAYFSTAVVFLALDFIWLTQVGPRLYNPILGPILAPQPRLDAAAVFYALYVIGLLYFAVLPASAGEALKGAVIKGALFGFFAYATYDLTNQATLSIWSTKITIADMLWGAFVSGAGAAGGFLITSKVVKAVA